MPEGQEDSKRTPRPRERRSRTQGTHMHYRPRYAKATASCWKSVKWYSAQKNRDNIRDNILHRRIVTIGVLGDNEDTQSEQNLPRGPRGQVSHNDPVVGSSIAAIRNSGEGKMWMWRSYHHKIPPGTRARVSGVVVAASICQLHLWSLLHIWVWLDTGCLKKIPFLENKSTRYFRTSWTTNLDNLVPLRTILTA